VGGGGGEEDYINDRVVIIDVPNSLQGIPVSQAIKEDENTTSDLLWLHLDCARGVDYLDHHTLARELVPP
jgi:hypothetical protein